MLSLIVAIAENGAIGKDNALLWHLSADLKRFKALTTGHAVVMGRKTFDSLPRKPLPNRRNIVLTHSSDFCPEGVEVVHSVDELLSLTRGEEECFLMGGASLYALLLPHAERLYLTFVHRAYPDADAFFPHIDLNDYQLLQQTEVVTDEKSGIAYHYADYQRK